MESTLGPFDHTLGPSSPSSEWNRGIPGAFLPSEANGGAFCYEDEDENYRPFSRESSASGRPTLLFNASSSSRNSQFGISPSLTTVVDQYSVNSIL